MPKTIKSKCKSGRKGLSNISNRANLPNQSKTISKQVEAHNNGGDDVRDNSALDRLHAVHAKLSQLMLQVNGYDKMGIHSACQCTEEQIDGLVIRAHKLNLANKLGACDIECFIKVLLATHSTLQGWHPKFEQAFGCQPEMSEKQIIPLPPIVTSLELNDENLFPLDNFRKSLSPSPLVSWPLGITSDCGRELFALTPLPKSRTCIDFKGFSTSDLTACGDKSKLASILRTPLPSQHLSKIRDKIEAETPQQLEVVIPQKLEAVAHEHVEVVTPEHLEVVTAQIPKNDISEYTQMFRGNPSHCLKEDTSKIFATPGLEISPPKTCLLMKPISESTPINFNFWKFDESPSSDDSQIPKSLRIKYPNLFKKEAYDCLPIKTPVQMSPHLAISPLKTCVLMMPSTEMQSEVQGVSDSHKPQDRHKYAPLSKISLTSTISIDCAESGKSGESIKQKNCGELTLKMKQAKEGAKKSPERCETTSLSRAVHKEKIDLSYMHRALDNPDSAYPPFAVAKSTPASKIASHNVQNTEQRGKQPGEQTLRRELWSKLKAASADAYPRASNAFLDKLQETSIEENSLTNNAPHISSLATSLSSRKDLIPERRSIALARSAARVSVMQSAQRSYTRDRLQKAGDVSILDPTKLPQVGKASKIDSTKMKTPRFQQKAKQAGETSYATHFHGPQR